MYLCKQENKEVKEDDVRIGRWLLVVQIVRGRVFSLWCWRKRNDALGLDLRGGVG